MNQIVYSGRLTAAIETRPAGEHAVHHFTVAVNMGERATFVPTEAWDMPHLETSLGKGSRVLIRGSLRQDQWETEAGEKRSRLLVTAYEVEFLDPRPARSGAEGASSRPPARARDAGPARSGRPASRAPSTPARAR